MSGRRMEVLRLYKTMMRESQKFTAYNYRNYFLNRIRDAFRENKGLTNQDTIVQEISRAKLNLSTIKRQVIVGQLYQTHKLVIENMEGAPGSGRN